MNTKASAAFDIQAKFFSLAPLNSIKIAKPAHNDANGHVSKADKGFY